VKRSMKMKKNDYINIDEIWYILRNYDIDQNVLRGILYKLYDSYDGTRINDLRSLPFFNKKNT
jgi:hypothetical protein